MALRIPAFNDAKSYGFEWLRALLEAALQEGVFNAGDLKVTAAAAGGQRVDIAAGTAAVKGDSGIPGTGLSQGLWLVVNDAAVANAVTLNASDATNPRVDQILLRVRDSSDLGSGADDAVFEVLTGVPTAGATLDNRSGAAALPNDRIRLADVLVPAASAAVTAGNVRDRRQWARGAYFHAIRTAGDYTTSGGTAAAMDTTNLGPRLETAGNPVRIALHGVALHSAANSRGSLSAIVDGTAIGADLSIFTSAVAAENNPAAMEHRFAPAAGSHLIQAAFRTIEAGTVTIRGSAATPLIFHVEETLRPNAANT